MKKQIVAKMVKEEGKTNVWECSLCSDFRCEFLSIMITHLFSAHTVQSLGPSEDTTAMLGVISDGTSWEGLRCRHCGTTLVKGKCPVKKKDCGRP